MSEAKTRFTLDKHLEMGIELYALRAQLIRINLDVGITYPESVHSFAKKALDGIDCLRSELDNQVCAENLEKEDMPKVYYGRPGEPDR